MDKKKKKNLRIVTYNSWHERRFKTTSEEVFPVYVSEERLLLYILGVALTGSETSLWILSQQLKKMKTEVKDK